MGRGSQAVKLFAASDTEQHFSGELRSQQRLGFEVSPSPGVTQGSPKLSQQQFTSPHSTSTAQRDQLPPFRDATLLCGSLSPSFPVSPAPWPKSRPPLLLFSFFFWTAVLLSELCIPHACKWEGSNYTRGRKGLMNREKARVA